MFELISFGSVIFFVLLAAFCLIELALLYNDEAGSALAVAVAFVVTAIAFVDGLPRPSWLLVAIYFAGGTAWVPVYWYLRLRKNRRGIIEALAIDNRYVKNIENYGKEVDGRWLPRHPSNASLTANGVIWPIAMPAYLATGWINLVVDACKGFFDKVQARLAVDAPVESETTNQ